MIPLIELRGAIPVSQGLGLPIVPSYIVCISGNMLPVPVIYLFARRFLEWGQDKKFIGGICRFFLVKGKHGGEKLQAKAGHGLFIALFLFVVFVITFSLLKKKKRNNLSHTQKIAYTAMFSALSKKIADGELFVVDKFVVESGKTKEIIR